MKQSKVRFWGFSLLVILSLALVACGGQQAAPMPKPKPAANSGGGDAASGGVTLEIGIKGEELAFDKDTLEATIAEGEELTVEFENTSQTQEHNWILFEHNDMDLAEEFNDTAANAVDTKYIPEDEADLMDTVIAHSATLQPGENETVTFPAPAAGDYLYICTVPGHFAAGDYGTLTIN